MRSARAREHAVGLTVAELTAAELTAGQRRRLVAGLEAVGQLGHWSELVWPALQEATGRRPEAVPEHLPESAAREWRRSRRTLRKLAARDAPAVRRLLPALSSGGAAPSAAAAAAFFEEIGLRDSGGGFRDRLRRYLEPFDHPGRLGETTLALQYLLEAFPVEQLSRDRRRTLRRRLAEALRSVRLEVDFHALVAAAADGIGLAYRPISYYRSRVDQSGLAFVRQQVSPISLSDRVGFAATAAPTVIVRLRRPFFFHRGNHVYYAGHAHVARD